ncbi:hypothetical protein BDV09DRAFT_190345 [Aspergillus tetrazonus]
MKLSITITSVLAFSSALTLTPRASPPRSDVRKCLDHPLGWNRHVKGASLAPLDATSPVEARSGSLGALEERACYKDAPYGCSGGYCWKAWNINKGEWCWTAKKAGLGAWIKCSKWQDCGTTTYACGRGGCPACGCGC